MNSTHQGMGHRKMLTADEYDVHLARDLYCWTKRAGATAKTKRRTRRRERQQAKREIREMA